MKTVIHIGMPKTGSTALQNALFNAHKELIRHGVLYPDPSPGNGLGKEVNHGLLAGAIRPYEIGPRVFRRYSEQDHETRVSNFLGQLSGQIKKHKPELLLLSSEGLWALGQHRVWLEKLDDLLKQTGIEETEFVGYVRGPSNLYLSQIQQQLKASSKFRPPGDYYPTRSLNSYTEFFGASKITVRLFDRSALVGEDIVTDFMSLQRPDLQNVISQRAQPASNNESLSAEGMVLLQQFRRHFYGDQDDVFNKPTSNFVRKLRFVETELDFPRPKLRPEISEYADYSGTEPLKLRDRYGIVFPKLDYSRLERGKFAEDPQAGGDVQDIVQVDSDRLEKMVCSLLQKRRKLDADLSKWLQSLPYNRVNPSPFSSALRKLRILREGASR